MQQGWLSSPLSYLLNSAGILANALDAELDALATRRVGVTLRPPRPAVTSIQQATGLNIAEIGRRHHRLLVAIEEFGRGEQSWFYREISRNQCIFGCPGTVPHLARERLIGRPLTDFAEPHPALKAVRILRIDETGDGWSEVHVDPQWLKF